MKQVKKIKKLPRRSLAMMALSLVGVMLATAYFIATQPSSVATSMRSPIYECAQCGRKNVFNNPAKFLPNKEVSQSKNFVPTITHIGHGNYRHTLETPRLLFREVTMNDAPLLFESFSKLENVQSSNYELHETVEDTKKELKDIINQYRKGKNAHWGICRKDNGEIIGLGGFVSLHPTHHRGTVGWWLREKYWGHGYGTEIARAVIEYGMKYLRLNRLDAVVRVDNIASARVLEKAGMSWSATFRDYWRVKDELGTFHQFVVLKKDIAEQLKKSNLS